MSNIPEHKQGCDALGGYGHGVGPCTCGAAAPAVQAIPQGWKPTSEQMMAGYEVSCRFGVLEARAFELAEQMFKAMLSASPALSVKQDEREKDAAVQLARDAVVAAARKWGDIETDDEVAMLAAELELSNALVELAAAMSSSPEGEKKGGAA